MTSLKQLIYGGSDMLILVMSRPERAEPGAYGETKKPKQFMITDWASEQLDKLAEELGTSRSEVIERLIRCGGLEAARKYETQTGQCKDNCS